MEKARSFLVVRVVSSLVLALIAFAVRYPSAMRVTRDVEGQATSHVAPEMLVGVGALIVLSLGCIWFGRRAAQIIGFVILAICVLG